MESLSRFGLTVVKDRTVRVSPCKGKKGCMSKSNCQEKKQMRVSKNN